MFQEFKKFVLRGNVVDLAVGVVMGAAFATVVSSFTAAFVSPLIGLIGGGSNLGKVKFGIGRASFQYGAFLQSALSFVITADEIFFIVVKPINHLLSRARKEESPDPTTKKCPECLSEIPIDARRCAFCTTELAAA
jgi:large conductance mechanosensitive channel